MKWWPVFLKVRKTLYLFISIVSLLWIVVYSVYLAHVWNSLTWTQRGIVFGMIGADLFTSVMIYLMAVVVFRIWLDLMRAVSLVLLHTAIAVVFEFFGVGFSCASFKTKAECTQIKSSFFVGSLVTAGLLFLYIPFLLVMSRVSCPDPKTTVEPFMNPPMTLRYSDASFASLTSTTQLMKDDSMYTYSRYSISPTPYREAAYRSSAPYIPVRRKGPPMVYTGGSYGAMGMPVGAASIRTASTRTASTCTAVARSVSVTPPTPKTEEEPMPVSLQTGEALSRSSSRVTTRKLPIPPVPPVPPVFINPFIDPVSRDSTPQTALSQASTFDSVTAYSPASLNPDHWPSLLPPSTTAASTRTSTATLSPPLAGIIPLWSPYEHRWVYSTESQLARPISASTRTSTVSTGVALRTDASSPNSFHSVSASISNLPGSLQPAYLPSTPSPVHTRVGSDPGPAPLHRSTTVAPHLTAHESMILDRPLPNPFPLEVAPERPQVRRFGSMPNAKFYMGQGGTYLDANGAVIGNVQNATHLAGALGRTPPRAQAAVSASSEQWKALVFSAATGRVA